MKKLLLLLIVLIGAPVFAQKVEVQALQSFSTLEPSKTLTVGLLEDFYVDEELVAPCGMAMTGLVFDIRDPKRLKRDAGFSFVPQYYIDCDGKKIYIKKQYYAKYGKALDKSKLAKSAALSAANQLIFSGFSYAAATIEGVAKNEEGNRLKSGAQALYESTPLSYANKGEDLELEKGDVFVLKFKNKKGEEEDD